MESLINKVCKGISVHDKQEIKGILTYENGKYYIFSIEVNVKTICLIK